MDRMYWLIVIMLSRGISFELFHVESFVFIDTF